jgi:endoglucanase
MTRLHSTFAPLRRRAGLVAGAVTAFLAAATFLFAANASAAAGCQVVYTNASQWGGGFVANVSITNLGDPINGWNLRWTFPSGQQVTNAWNATISPSSGTVTATNMSYNAAIPTNGKAEFGFQGSWSGSNTIPASFTLNGTTCTGTVNPSSPRPSSPGPSSPGPSSSSSQPPSQNPRAVVAAMQPGWNLGNTFDATGQGETSWGNPAVTTQLLDAVKANGFKSIRIPGTWMQYQGAAPNYTIDAAHLARYKQVVDQALARDLYVMINVHHDSWQWINQMPTNPTGTLQRFNATWTQLANTFRDSSQKLLFESNNEPQFANGSGDAQYIDLNNQLNASFRNIVRASGGNNATRILVLPTLNTDNAQAKVDGLASAMSSYNDPNLVATFHYYGYWPFSVNIAGGYRYDATVQNDLTAAFDRLYNAFIARGIPVILGEYGLLGFDRSTGTIEQGEKLKYFEYFGYYARSRGITTMLWDNGQHLNRTAFTWSDNELINQIKSSWTTRSGTASSDQVYVSRTNAITAKTLTLNLNGLSFTGLYQGSTALVQGTDYTVSGSTLTLTQAAVTRLVGSRAYGINATLQARFSAGVPWRIDIKTFDPPILTSSSGTTSAYTIPTQFRGDQLATMEAKYSDGTFAGPQNWTSFKEFDYTFTPNYTANTITLKPEFFAEVNDARPVTLTFHFWSGTQVTYTVTKSGSNVTGVAA